MPFYRILNEIMEELHCSARNLAAKSGLSAAAVSRYRRGERVPAPDTDAFAALSRALCAIAREQGKADFAAQIESKLKSADDMPVSVDFTAFRLQFSALLSAFSISLSELSRALNFDASYLSRIKNGQRQPSDLPALCRKLSQYFAKRLSAPEDRARLAAWLECEESELISEEQAAQKLFDALSHAPAPVEGPIGNFLSKLNDFDLNEYIRAIRFDELKVPNVPAVATMLPVNRTARNLRQMMDVELDFLKMTVLSRSNEDVIMYSDMPMEEMARDPEFPKKWMFGMAMMLKRVLHLHQIHCLGRGFDEMMLGLESFIPMYMTGQISPYYLKNQSTAPFHHFLKVSGTAALSGEAIVGHHAQGRYFLTNNREEVAYYRARAEALLSCASPLMEIFREDSAETFRKFLQTDAAVPGARRRVLSSPPLFTADESLLREIFRDNGISDADCERAIAFAAQQRRRVESILEHSKITDEIPALDEESFAEYPMALELPQLFLERDVFCSFEQYSRHLALTRAFAAAHETYHLQPLARPVFCNLQITMREGAWALVSKSKAPSIHFLIRHPKMCEAIENMVPPIVEE